MELLYDILIYMFDNKAKNFLKILFFIHMFISSILADNMDDLLNGFDKQVPKIQINKNKNYLKEYGIEGKFTQKFSYSINNKNPYDKFSSAKSSVFLEINQNLSNSFKLKFNANAFYDLNYKLRSRDNFSKEDRDELESEIELFDAYLQGQLSENLDLKVGRQVVVWGKSDTIRVTDVLNPLDNRQPAMVDIEKLRLSCSMIKLDFYYESWRVSPILISEQRLTKKPPFGGNFNPNKNKFPKQKIRNTPTFALDLAGEFSGFDINFYLANIYAQDEINFPTLNHKYKIKMLATALNYIHGSWLFKGEFAYKKDFQFLQDSSRKYNGVQSLLGIEYNGIADTKLSYDLANKHLNGKNSLFKKDTYQHAFRASSDFLNATLHANYLISLFGEKLDKGGFQRAWFKYDIADEISSNIGIVVYMSGNKFFDAIDDNDMVFMDLVYSF